MARRLEQGWWRNCSVLQLCARENMGSPRRLSALPHSASREEMRFAFSRSVCDVASIVTWHHLVMVRSVPMRLRPPPYPKRATTKIVPSVLLVGFSRIDGGDHRAHSFFYTLINGKKVIGELFYEGLNHLGNPTCHLLADYCNLHSVPCTRGHLLLRSVYQ
jgi:hypothetical protein